MEKYEDIIQELIDFINQQSGVYMDSMAGFSGHKIRVERQVARVLRPTEVKIGIKGTEGFNSDQPKLGITAHLLVRVEPLQFIQF